MIVIVMMTSYGTLFQSSIGTTLQTCQDDDVPTRTRRADALTRERIVEAAVELLDTAGEDGLTFRALTERLATGPGAIYWHVANKDELLGAATEALVAAALEAPQDDVHAVALGLFDVIDEHPWLALQLTLQFSRRPGGPVTTRIFESLGRHVSGLGVPEDRWFTTTSALVHYVLGAAAQNSANAHVDVDRAAFLDTVATAWEGLDPDDYPFTRAVADEMRGHDDREQFLAGIDLVLTGITITHPPAG
jgi:AcrR family transcriptional regulator